MKEKWDLTHKWKDNINKWKEAEKKWKFEDYNKKSVSVNDLEIFYEIKPEDEMLFDEISEYREHTKFVKAMTNNFKQVIQGYFEQLRSTTLNNSGFHKFNKLIMDESGYQKLTGHDGSVPRYGQISFYNANLRNTSNKGFVQSKTVIEYYPERQSFISTNMLSVPTDLPNEAIVRTVAGFRGVIRSISQGTSIFFNIMINEYKIF